MISSMVSAPSFLTSKTAAKAKKKADLLERLTACREQPDNQKCADCGDLNPGWASLLKAPIAASTINTSYGKKLGIFCCNKCCSYHMQMGRGVCEVKNIKTADDWSEEEVKTMETSGNIASNAIYEGLILGDTSKKPDPSNYKAQAKFVEDKYKHLQFFCKKTYQDHGSWFTYQQLQEMTTSVSTSSSLWTTSTTTSFNTNTTKPKSITTSSKSASTGTQKPKQQSTSFPRVVSQGSMGPSKSASDATTSATSTKRSSNDKLPDLDMSQETSTTFGPSDLEDSSSSGLQQQQPKRVSLDHKAPTARHSIEKSPFEQQQVEEKKQDDSTSEFDASKHDGSNSNHNEDESKKDRSQRDSLSSSRHNRRRGSAEHSKSPGSLNARSSHGRRASMMKRRESKRGLILRQQQEGRQRDREMGRTASSRSCGSKGDKVEGTGSSRRRLSKCVSMPMPTEGAEQPPKGRRSLDGKTTKSSSRRRSGESSSPTDEKTKRKLRRRKSTMTDGDKPNGMTKSSSTGRLSGSSHGGGMKRSSSSKRMSVSANSVSTMKRSSSSRRLSVSDQVPVARPSSARKLMSDIDKLKESVSTAKNITPYHGPGSMMDADNDDDDDSSCNHSIESANSNVDENDDDDDDDNDSVASDGELSIDFSVALDGSELSID